jgi:hypothetical protein
MPRPGLQRAECAAHADHYGLRRLHARQGLEYASRTMSAEPEHDPVPNDAQQAQLRDIEEYMRADRAGYNKNEKIQAVYRRLLSARG